MSSYQMIARWWPTIKKYFPVTFAGLFSFASVLPSGQYAMAFPDTKPSDVSYDWLMQQSNGRIFDSVANGACTVMISGCWTAAYLIQSSSVIFEESATFFRTRANAKRYLFVMTLTLLAAITNSSISDGPYSGAMRRVAEVFGFVIGGALSFIGLTQLVSYLFDQDHSAQARLTHTLMSMNPEQQNHIDHLLEGRSLSEENMQTLLQDVCSLAQQEGMVLSKEIIHYKKEVADLMIAGLCTTFIAIIFWENGFDGTNSLSNNQLSDFSQGAKLAIGFLPGLPATVFNFFAVKDTRATLEKAYPEIISTYWNMLKATALFGAMAGNATWLYSLARCVLANEDNIFSLSLDSSIAGFFPVICYLTSYFVGINGLVPALFPPVINATQPHHPDLVKWLTHHQLPTETIQQLKNHSLFKHEAGVGEEKIEMAQTAADNFTVSIDNAPSMHAQACQPT